MELGLGLTNIIPPIVYFISVFVILLTLFYKIEVGIFFLVPLLPQQSLLQRIHELPLGKDFVDILVLALIIKWILSKNKGEEGFFVKTSFNLPILLIIIWTYIELWRGSFYLGVGAPISIRDPRFVVWKNFMLMPIIYFIVLNNVKNPKHIKILVLLMTLSILMMGLHFRDSFQWKDTSAYSDDLRLTGTFTYLSPNAIGSFFCAVCYGFSLFVPS